MVTHAAMRQREMWILVASVARSAAGWALYMHAFNKVHLVHFLWGRGSKHLCHLL